MQKLAGNFFYALFPQSRSHESPLNFTISSTLGRVEERTTTASTK